MEGIESMPRKDEFPLGDNFVQIALARLAFKLEHPEVQAPTNKEIMTSWLTAHAARYREVADQYPDTTIKLSDEDALAKLYESILKKHDADSATMH